ncbi:MAG: Z-ring formation inhibitor MciZ [Firmicutes bacterium]|nr:Z-ring formation inhibitor MciZ [Bacillota bacterium]
MKIYTAKNVFWLSGKVKEVRLLLKMQASKQRTVKEWIKSRLH